MSYLIGLLAEIAPQMQSRYNPGISARPMKQSQQGERNMAIGVSALSGLLWGILGAFLTQKVAGLHSWIAAPAGIPIGIFVYYLSRRTYQKSLWHLVPVSILTTFVAVALFGLCVGGADLTRDIPNRIGWAVVVQGMNTCLWGLVFIPLLWSLFLLSYANHAAVRFIVQRYSE